MIELLLQTGLRIGELSRLKLKHLNLANNSDREHLHVEPYSSIEARKVPLNLKAKKVIQDYLPSLEADHEEHPLFPTRDGNHIIIRNIRSSIDRAMAKAGIIDASVNDLRNTFIVNQLKAGVPMELIADVVGHRSKTTTQKYLELLNQDYFPTGQLQLAEI